jgi:mannose-6-phosphate isomerase-like protein (cupin superfamily)
MVVIVKGTANGAGQKLAPRDIFLVHGPKGESVGGPGEAIVVESPPDAPCTSSGAPLESPQIVRTGRTQRLTWAKGAMSAWLDVDATRSPGLYVGRLEGTSAVAEHAHEGSWELLAAIDGAGTFTLDGVPARLGPRQIVVVPAGTRHAWTPDPGSKLVAVQLYWPPGPEQRFVELANAEARASSPLDDPR